ncbi:MAG: SIMPL domain-containing protein [Acidobacteria bacterium]|nr:SIMPL domain-containing protein [Acidobacteriota bacterium]
MRRRLLGLIALSAALAAAQESRPVRTTVRASGEAVLTSRPDRARIDIGVTSQAATAQAAAGQNARQASAVLAEIKKILPPGGDVRTVNYSIQPNYKHQPNTAPLIVGYTANNTVQVRIDDLALVSKVIDTATRLGANTIRGIHFTLKDEQAVRNKVLAEATRNARAAAEAIAGALGVRVVRVLSADTESPVSIHPVRDMMMMEARAAAVPPTPIEPGNIEVRATVIVTLEVAP